ncbi:MAG: KamA family radical SAM protein [Thermoleophilia bacterium]
MPEVTLKPFASTPRTPSRPGRSHTQVSDLASNGLDAEALSGVVSRFAFRASDYYVGLIDWNDGRDPIRRLIVPSVEELEGSGSLDASNEAANTPLPGLQHKYADTALLLVTDQCAGFCRYCFRKRLFSPGSHETHREYAGSVAYIAAHPEITDVLLTGGDPLTLTTARLRPLVRALIAIPHVRTVRIGSKVPAFDPQRISSDADLLDLVSEVVASGRSLYVMTHFDHPHELTSAAVAAIAALRAAGAVCLNQCPIGAGINDDARVLAELFQRCTDAGCPQYYVFQCRPTIGTAHFAIPIVRAIELMETARQCVSGLSRRARLCLSHESGKIEIVAADERAIYARYHRAKNPADAGRFLIFERDDAACWVDELVAAGAVV